MVCDLGHKVNKKDLPLYLTLLSLRGLLYSPIGSLIMRLGNKHLIPDSDNWLEVTQVQLQLSRLPLAFSGYRLAQMSDFHIGTWATREHLVQAVEQINLFQPDLVALTGDFVTHNPELYTDDLIYILKKIRSRDGVVAVLGNHDHWTDPKVVRQVLAQAGVNELNNRTLEIVRGSDKLHIAGIDDVMEELHDFQSLAEQLAGAGCTILLAHEPDIADDAAATGLFDLQISGHTHGGQVIIPKYGAVILPRLGKKYYAGLYQIDGMALYTNRGLGTAELQFRYKCPAEVTCFELFPSQL